MQRAGEGILSEFRIFETEELLSRLMALPKRDREFITVKLRSYVYPQLRTQPHSGLNIKKLKGYKPQTWRYRIGAYRIFYMIAETEQTVFILTIDARKDAYR